MSSQKTIVILGMGFGGLNAYQHLRSRIDRRAWKIILVNETDHFVFSPLLHEVATGSLDPGEVVEGIRTIIDGGHAQFVQAKATSIDAATSTVHTTAGSVSYDHLIIALGSETNVDVVPGVREHALQLKTLADAEQFRERFSGYAQQAAQTQDLEERKRLLSVAIVGGGATGVELAAETAELIEHTFKRLYRHALKASDFSLKLLQAGPDLLPDFDPRLRRYALTVLREKGVHVDVNMRVSSVDGQGIMLEGGTRESAGTVIWAGGVKPIRLPSSPALPLNERNRIDTEETLRVRGSENIWAIGDCAGMLPPRAQVAVQQGVAVAANVLAAIRQESLRPFLFRSKGDLVSLGQWRAAGTIGGIQWTGPLAWLLWRAVYLFNFASWAKRLEIIVDWTIHLFMPRDITTTRT